jgi:hypothetical protein
MNWCFPFDVIGNLIIDCTGVYQCLAREPEDNYLHYRRMRLPSVP